MTNKNSLTFFDQLATEIVFEIFDYLSCNEIFYAFFHFNQRFNSILLKHYQYLNKLETPTRNFCFWQTILPIIESRIEYLTITTIDFCFSLDLFPNLKSVTISSPLPIYCDKLTSILESKQFHKLTIFKIQSEILYRNNSFGTPEIFQAVFHRENSLQMFELLPQLYLSSFKNINNVNIQSLTIKLTNIKDLLIVFQYTPNLKYLNLFLSSLYFNKESKQNIDLTEIKLKKFFLTLQDNRINEQDFLVLTNFIKQFSSSLIRLSLNLNYVETKEDQFNGFLLQRQLLKSMTQLKSFHLYAILDQEPTDVENLLLTFRNQFWYDHNWSVGIHGKYLYTLPFHFNKLDSLTDFDQIKSSNFKILTSPSTWSHLTSIDLSECTNLNLNLIKQLKMKTPNLTTIILNELTNSPYASENETNFMDTTLDSVTTVHCKGEYLQNIKQWLINIIPNTKYLVLSYQPQPAAPSSNRTVFLHKLDAYFRGKRTTTDYIYYSNIQHVKIKLILKDIDDLYKHVLRLVRELLEMFKNLRSFIFEFYQIHYDTRYMPFTDLDKLIQLLNMDKISKKYQIKHIDNYFQFIKNDYE